MNKTLFLMVGVPASGKSTWAKSMVDEIHLTKAADCIYISRDEIRFSMVREDEAYFAHEDDVFNEFIRQINAAIASNATYVFVDATHITERSRNNTLDKLNLNNVDIVPVVFDLPLEICIAQNKNRTGRARVPESAIRRMYYSFNTPTENEKYKYDHIIYARKGRD